MILSSSKNPNNRLKAKKNVVYSCYLHSSSHPRAMTLSRVRQAATLAEKNPLAATFRKPWLTHQQVFHWLYDGICYIYVLIFSENCWETGYITYIQRWKKSFMCFDKSYCHNIGIYNWYIHVYWINWNSLDQPQTLHLGDGQPKSTKEKLWRRPHTKHRAPRKKNCTDEDLA